MSTVSIALVHHPVLNKNDEIIGSAVTNLDLHDIARAAKTYGIDRYYITTPYDDQRQLAGEILNHWQTGYGSKYNPARKEALAAVHLADSVETAVAELEKRYGRDLFVAATSARTYDKSLSYNDLKTKIAEETPVLLLFGTAHGLAPELIERADGVLEPILGSTGYNHLSVRSAASIIFDRLLGS